MGYTERQAYIMDRCKPAANGCWEWTLGLSVHGYGQAWDGERTEPSSRAAYRAFVGTVPDDMCVCHTCDNRTCVNPDHLWLGTKADNLKDMWAKGRGYSPPRTGCGPHSNPTPCRICNRDKMRRHRARKRELVNA